MTRTSNLNCFVQRSATAARKAAALAPLTNCLAIDVRFTVPLLILAFAANSLSGMTIIYGGGITDYKHQDISSSVVTLDPDPIFSSSLVFSRPDPSAAFIAAMTESKAAADWKDKLTFDYTGSLNGTLTITAYYAAHSTATRGGAQFVAHYNRAAGDPAAADLFWIQVVDTTAPNGGETIPYPDVYNSNYAAGSKLPFYFRPDETALDPNPRVTGGDQKIRSSNYKVNGNTYNYDIAFTDWPQREPTNTWRGELFLATYVPPAGDNKGMVKVYDGVYWGFDVDVPEPSTFVLFACGLAVLVIRVIHRAS